MLLGFLPEGDATCRSAAGAGAAVDLDQMTLDKRVIIKVITGVVWGDDISQLLLLLRNGLLLAGVSLLEFIHHGNYTVETFGHAGPHPVLKEQNTPSATPISRTDYISGCLAVFKTAKYSRGEGVRQTEGKPCEAAKNLPVSESKKVFPSSVDAGFTSRRSTGNCCLDILRLYSKVFGLFPVLPFSVSWVPSVSRWKDGFTSAGVCVCARVRETMTIQECLHYA